MAAFLLGGTSKCPKCGGYQFSAPTKADPDENVTCLACGHVATIKETIEAGRTEPNAGK